MITLFRKSPFFIASVLVHIIIFALITLKLNAEIIRQLIQKDTVFEVELLNPKEDINPIKSVIEYQEALNIEEKLTVSKQFEFVKQQKLEYLNPETKTPDPINVPITTPNIKVIRTENKRKASPENKNNDVTLIAKIIYKTKSNPDIHIKEQKEMEEESVKAIDNSNRIDQQASIRIIPNNSTQNQKASDTISEQLLSQDYELVRRMIEEKANKFVPIIYQKKLLEKKKRTALVEMTLSEKGYVNSYVIKKSTGLLEMDKSIRAILHLAEPYVYVPRPVNIELIFFE